MKEVILVPYTIFLLSLEKSAFSYSSKNEKQLLWRIILNGNVVLALQGVWVYL